MNNSFDKLKLFNDVYYIRDKNNYHKKMSKYNSNDAKILSLYYLKKKIEDFNLDLSFINKESFFSVSLGMSFYNKFDKDEIPYYNITYKAIKEMYRELYIISSKHDTYNHIKLSTFDFMLLENKKLITDYILFLRSFPFFNYFMISKRDEYTSLSTDDIKRIDYVENNLSSYSFVNKIDHKDDFFYIENIVNILTGNLNVFDYYFTTDNIFKSELEIKVLATYQFLLEEDLGLNDENIDPDNHFEIVLNNYDTINDNVKNMAMKYLINKYLIYKLRGAEEESSDTMKAYFTLEKELHNIEKFYPLNFLNEQYYNYIDNIFTFLSKLFIILLHFKDRDDVSLIYTLLFSNKNRKIICYINGFDKNFLFNTIKYFNKESNIELEIN